MIRILLVDDQRVIREGLQALLEPEVDFQVVGSANDGQTAIEQVEALQPDVVLIDIQMPRMDGVTATRIITQRFSETKVLVLSSYDDEASLANALRAGAKGYLLKDTPATELADAVRSVNKGYAQIGPGLFDKINIGSTAANFTASDQVNPRSTALTPLEMEVTRALKTFNPQFLPEVVRLTVELGAVARVLAQVDSELKHDLTNLPVLYLVGALSAHADEENKTLALFYLRLGFKEGIRQGLSCEELLLFYQEAVRLESEEAFAWLTQVYGPWDNEAGLSFLLEEAACVFGSDSTQYQTLLALKQVRVMRTLGEGCAALGSMIEVLNQVKQFCQVLEV
ncbi:MAG: response regulator transcription factor [Chroococcidiopsidaceae cyanobacterium CP_BM_RX_35]|nr:response regulator transcription factor [Chroococcidiopsidaceae cyanobacterium CP_BM_RX_35]